MSSTVYGNLRPPSERFELRRSIKLSPVQVQKRQVIAKRPRFKNPLCWLTDILIDPIFQILDKRVGI